MRVITGRADGVTAYRAYFLEPAVRLVKSVLALNDQRFVQRSVPMQHDRLVRFEFDQHVDDFIVLIDIEYRIGEMLKIAEWEPADMAVIKIIVRHHCVLLLCAKSLSLRHLIDPVTGTLPWLSGQFARLMRPAFNLGPCSLEWQRYFAYPPSMNLKFYLLLHIVLVAIFCLAAASVYVLYRADRQTKHELRFTTESMAKQLEIQLLRIDAGFDRAERFPDLALWRDTRTVPGTCVRFVPEIGATIGSICHGAQSPAYAWPDAFESIYGLLFDPGTEITRPVRFKSRVFGSVNITPDAEMELAHAWTLFAAIAEVSLFTVAGICLLVYAVIHRALLPANMIEAVLVKMHGGDLSLRLPPFKLLEWQRTAAAVNELAANQQQLLAEGNRLSLQLMTLQEEERRYLARELHDELGQCLAAVNAVAASIAQTAKLECPVLVSDAENITRINRRIMETVHTLLVRLRPADIDELGLEACLNTLISEWAQRTGGRIRYRLAVHGDCDGLQEPLPVALFRIAQECLTNIVKHAAATEVSLSLNVTPDSAVLTVTDNGPLTNLPIEQGPGIGLAGIRERVFALNGRLNLELGQAGGLAVRVELPVSPISAIAS